MPHPIMPLALSLPPMFLAVDGALAHQPSLSLNLPAAQIAQTVAGEERQGLWLNAVGDFIMQYRVACMAQLASNPHIPQELSSDFVCGCMAHGYVQILKTASDLQDEAASIIKRTEGMHEQEPDEDSVSVWFDADLFLECIGDPRH